MDTIKKRIDALRKQHMDIVAAVEVVFETSTKDDLVRSIQHLDKLWERHREAEAPLMELARQISQWDSELRHSLELFGSDIELAAKRMDAFISSYQDGIKAGDSVIMRKKCIELETLLTASFYVEETHIFLSLEHHENKTDVDVLGTFGTTVRGIVSSLRRRASRKEEHPPA